MSSLKKMSAYTTFSKHAFVFLMLVLLVEYIFLTTFNGLYFNHQLHITITISSSSYMFHGDLLWAAFILELYIRIQIRINQLLIFTEKFSPLPGFEPRTSPVPSRYATNWAILAWINMHPYFTSFWKMKNRILTIFVYKEIVLWASNPIKNRAIWHRKSLNLNFVMRRSGGGGTMVSFT